MSKLVMELFDAPRHKFLAVDVYLRSAAAHNCEWYKVSYLLLVSGMLYDWEDIKSRQHVPPKLVASMSETSLRSSLISVPRCFGTAASTWIASSEWVYSVMDTKNLPEWEDILKLSQDGWIVMMSSVNADDSRVIVPDCVWWTYYIVKK